ncbi:type II secretion system GspH family protein [Streptococcus oralis]|uniref:type II secretion system GspH family protein n=1 Tax=Streptococcus oralis TaxID=1303 RepID=UPI001BD3E864|nr:type II secretion system GspH family protein [Streptococcus oralis]MBS9401963.1 type II secretion system protein [Streptococcus oralis]
MNNSGIKKSHKRLLIVLSIAIITAGGVFMFSMLGKSQEERRNREYEVSLVNALKNSYEGIEEVTITNPSYSSIPSDAWGADVKLKFFDGTSKEHVLAFDINSNKIRIGVYNKDDEEFQHFLNSRRGSTKSKVKVKYSNGSEGEL